MAANQGAASQRNHVIANVTEEMVVNVAIIIQLPVVAATIIRPSIQLTEHMIHIRHTISNNNIMRI